MRPVTWAVPAVLAVLLTAGCGGQNAAPPVTVTVTTTVTDIKTVAEVQTAVVAPPAQVQTVISVVTRTVTAAATTQARPEGPLTTSTGSRTTFNSATLAAAVRKLITDAPPAGYGITGVTDTSCPNDQPVRARTTFLCHATIDNASKAIPITVQDDSGKYQVGLPG